MATISQQLPILPTFHPIKSMGLLTTVAQLPHNYKIRYITPESPLDLSVRTAPLCPITPPSTPSPLKKRYIQPSICSKSIDSSDVGDIILSNDNDDPGNCEIDTLIVRNISEINESLAIPPKEVTPSKRKSVEKPLKAPTKSSKKLPNPSQLIKSNGKDRRHKAVRKLKFDEHKSSPVSGTIIRKLEDIDSNIIQESGDIDPQYNIVEVTEEAKAEIAAIENVIGAYQCKLCRNEFDDAFGLARHRCSCIVLLEYCCPECGKRFNCPANLASHRRWHKPKSDNEKVKSTGKMEPEQQYPCSECGKFFKRATYLRKHLATHRKSSDKSNEPTNKKLKLTNSNSCESFLSSNSCTSELDSEKTDRLVMIIDPNDDDDDSTSASNGRNLGFYPFTSYEDTGRVYNFKHSFTEEENIAAAALAHLRNGPSVIRHTMTMAVEL